MYHKWHWCSSKNPFTLYLKIMWNKWIVDRVDSMVINFRNFHSFGLFLLLVSIPKNEREKWTEIKIFFFYSIIKEILKLALVTDALLTHDVRCINLQCKCTLLLWTTKSKWLINIVITKVMLLQLHGSQATNFKC